MLWSAGGVVERVSSGDPLLPNDEGEKLLWKLLSSRSLFAHLVYMKNNYILEKSTAWHYLAPAIFRIVADQRVHNAKKVTVPVIV